MELNVLNRNIIKLKLIHGLGNVSIKKIIQGDKNLFSSDIDIKNICDYLSINKAENIDKVKIEALVDEIVKDLEKGDIKLTNIFDNDYPSALKNIYNSPVLLFYKGEISYDYDKSIAIVGTRKFTSYGETITRKFIENFSQNEMNIISGLASGIDSIAHIHAVKNNMKCIGVIGHGHNLIYPSTNAKLYEKILENQGCVISEFFPNTEPLPAYFPLRNRIIAGLAKGTLVIEAASKSGSLITAKCAFDENRDVYAIPSDITKISSQGCNELIKSGIGKMVTDPNDILEDYFDLTNKAIETLQVKDFSSHKYYEIIEVLQKEKLSSDELLLKISFDILKLNEILTELELEGILNLDEQNKWIVVS